MEFRGFKGLRFRVYGGRGFRGFWGAFGALGSVLKASPVGPGTLFLAFYLIYTTRPSYTITGHHSEHAILVGVYYKTIIYNSINKTIIYNSINKTIYIL